MADLTVHSEEFERVSAEWTGLIAQTPNPIPFSTPAWQRVWLQHFQAGQF